MKKIIAIVAVIALITACFCIGAFAYENGDVLKAGTIITFGETVEYSPTTRTNISFTSNGQNFESMANISTGSNIGLQYNSTKVYNAMSQEWINENYKTIKLTSDYTLSGQWLEFFTQEPINVTMPPMQNVVDNTKATFATTLTVATSIIAWLMVNQLALVGLYMYILIALVASGKRFIKG